MRRHSITAMQVFIVAISVLLLASLATGPRLFAQNNGSTATAPLDIQNPMVMELWAGKAPDEVEGLGPERVRMSPKSDRKHVEVTEPTRLITDVSKPSVTIHRPPKDEDIGTAILICPGGGYWDLYWQLEGEEVAAWLNSRGITGGEPMT